jgi:hypothetical protein
VTGSGLSTSTGFKTSGNSHTHPGQNQAEREIQELKKVTRRILHSSKAPPRTWCFALEWATMILRP